MKPLTRDADRLACLLYKGYLEKRKTGVSKADAKMFGGSGIIRSTYLPDATEEDVDETCRELDRAGYASVQYADDVAYQVLLTDEAVIYMENRFKDGFVGVLKFLANFIP